MEPLPGDEHEKYSYSGLPVELLQVVGSTLSSEQLRNARLVCTGWATALAHCMPAVTVALPRQASERIFRQPLVLCSSGVLNSAQAQDYSAVPKAHTPRHQHQQLLGRRRSCRHSQDGHNNIGTSSSLGGCSSCKRACTSHNCCSTGGVGVSGGGDVAGSSSSQVGLVLPPSPPLYQLPSADEDPFAAAAAAAAAAAFESQSVSRDKPSPFATEMGQAVLDCLLEDPLLTAATRGAAAQGGGTCAAGAAAGTTVGAHSTCSSSIHHPMLPRHNAIKAAISMPPTLAEQAAASQQQQAMQVDEHQMRKLSSVPASSAHGLPRTTRRVSKPGTSSSAATAMATDTPQHQQLQQLQDAAAQVPPHHAVVTTVGPVLQGWSSLPSAGLRTCSSLKQLNLKLSGAPPSPADLLDLSKLVHLTHLSFKQVDLPEAEADGDGGGDCCQAHDDYMMSRPSPVEEDSMEMMACDSSSSLSISRSISRSSGLSSGTDTIVISTAPAAGAVALDAAVTSTLPVTDCAGCGAGSSSSKSPEPAGLLKRSHSIGPARLQSGLSLCIDMMMGAGAGTAAGLAATASALEHCHIHSNSSSSAAAAPRLLRSARSAGAAGLLGGAGLDSMQVDRRPCCCCDDDTAAADARDQSSCRVCSPAGDGSSAAVQPTHSISCSVITPDHVEALAQLPYLSSLELAPKHGAWDAAGREGLLHLVKLTGLTKLSITWGDAAAATAPLSAEDAAAAAQTDQLPLQQCLAGMTCLQELCIHGAAVVDAAVLQRLQQLRTLTAEGLQVVNSDVMAFINAQAEQQRLQDQQQQEQQQAEAEQGPGLQAGSSVNRPVLSAAAPQQPQAPAGRWASLPHLQYVHAVHPASDISLLLQSTLTPQLSHLGFVTRGPSDFARLLGQHGKLRTLHLAFAEEESWHPIAVVRLPTALPSLTSLTIDGKFWLPNSLIVALGVMEVPLEHLSLTCKLAPPCLQRLQHLKHLKRLALHHVSSAGLSAAGPGPAPAPVSGGKAGSSKGTTTTNDAMLQLPAKLLPPQLQELEISNGWILH